MQRLLSPVLEQYIVEGDFEGVDELVVNELSWTDEALKYHFGALGET